MLACVFHAINGVFVAVGVPKTAFLRKITSKYATVVGTRDGAYRAPSKLSKWNVTTRRLRLSCGRLCENWGRIWRYACEKRAITCRSVLSMNTAQIECVLSRNFIPMLCSSTCREFIAIYFSFIACPWSENGPNLTFGDGFASESKKKPVSTVCRRGLRLLNRRRSRTRSVVYLYESPLPNESCRCDAELIMDAYKLYSWVIL